MPDQGVLMEVVDILLGIDSDIDPQSLDEKTSLSDDLGMGTAEKRTVAGEVNQRFGVGMTEPEADRIDTIEELVDYIEANLD